MVLRYIEALCKEIKGWRGADDYLVDSVFIGGGTPSLLLPEEIGQILDTLRSRFRVEEHAEISMESNPGTFCAPQKKRLAGYRSVGINRLSLGVQSLQADTLRFLERIHTKEQFLESYQAARDIGFDNINIDLMFGVPGMGLGPWQEDLKEITALSPEHVSFYSLILEEGTKLWQMYEAGDFQEMDPAMDRRMYGAALDILGDAGYEQYEISNAARPGRACRHNLKYWSMEEYLGFGLGAHSYLLGTRFSNTVDLDTYITYWTQNEDCFERIPVSEFHQNTAQDEISEYIFTGLRKTKGIRPAAFRERFSKDIFDLYGKEIEELIDQKLLEIQGEYIRLTRWGIDISNQVFLKFIL